MTRIPPTSAATNPASIFSLPTSSPTQRQRASETAMPATAGTAPGPTSTPLPVRPGTGHEEVQQVDQQQNGGDLVEEARAFKLPKLRLKILDLNHPGASRFLSAVNASSILAKSVQTVLRLLYQKPSNSSVPGTRSVTLYLEDVGGVAYTKGSSLDDDHKEIHFSLCYINNIKSAPEGSKGDVTGAYEIHGVLVHELVHCFQHNGRGTCPGGLIEGIADWVRLRANLGAPHWKRDTIPDRWDQGYEKTAYFLDWLEERYGAGTVGSINETLRVGKYHKDRFWKDLLGSDVETLWKEYLRHVKKGDE